MLQNQCSEVQNCATDFALSIYCRNCQQTLQSSLSIDQSIKQASNTSINQSVSQWNNQQINQYIHLYDPLPVLRVTCYELGWHCTIARWPAGVKSHQTFPSWKKNTPVFKRKQVFMTYLKLWRDSETQVLRILCSLYASIVVLYVMSNGIVCKQHRWRHIRVSLHCKINTNNYGC